MLENKFNLDYIDSMRGVAILMVLIVHSTMFFSLVGITELPFNLEKVIYSGKYGVSLFFIVSAYTLFRSLDLRKESGFKSYFIRRFFRIAPMYYLVLITLFFLYFIKGISDISVFNLVTHILFINGFFVNYFNSIIGVEWTIFVEVIFYLFLPVIYSYKKHLLALTAFALFSSFVTGLYVMQLDGLKQVQFAQFPLTWLPVFMFGVLIYKYQDRYKETFTKYKKSIFLFIICTFILLSYSNFPGRFLFFSILMAIFYMLNKYNIIFFFNNSFLKKIGKYSFSIYLLHIPIFDSIRIYFKGGAMLDSQIVGYLIITLIAISTVFFISHLTYRLVEKPFMAIGLNFIKNKHG